MNAIHAKLAAVFLLCSLAAPELFGGAGNNNPTGNAGGFNGDVTTGCDYDPYTANATRSITDLVVAGGVGTYPLAFTRVANSRYSVGQDDFGNGLPADFGGNGNWVHSYEWAIDNYSGSSGHPTSFTVRYDDGRIVTFRSSTNGDPYYRGGQGVTDRLQVFWDSGSAGRAYLIKPDGGKVWFSIAIISCKGTCHQYNYTVQGIIDPYGQTTTIAGSPQSGLVTVTEPAGRWIKLYYTTAPNNLNCRFIYQLTASDGRSVQYGYTYDQYQVSATLTQVTYYNDPNLVATYTYQYDNTGSGGNSLLGTAVDPMYSGPMWKIAYNYATGLNPDGTAAVYGQILSENSFNVTGNVSVSTLTVVNSTTRKETRADGKTRTFTYNSTMGFLTNWTDFKANGASEAYDTNGYTNTVTDFNNHTTNLTKNAFTGALLTATFPSTPEDTASGTPQGVVSYTYGSASCADPNNTDSNNPYYVCTATDEGGHTTTYLRDTAKRVTQVNYPDGGTESVQYTSFGEVTSHTLRTGAVETFTYDARGLLQNYRDPYHTTGNPNVWYQYDSIDRISGITDTLGSGSGDINHTTNFVYNSRGDINLTTLPVDPNDGQRHTTSTVYNLTSGTIASVTDPLGHITSFTYDDYRRLLTTTTPARFNGDTMNHIASVYYDATGTGNDYTYTGANPTWVVSPSGKKATNTYDENRRTISTTVGVCVNQGGGGGGGGGRGTPTPTPSPTPTPPCDAATITFGYDSNGNLTAVVAPKEQPGQAFAGQSTITSYDERNRPYLVRDPLGNLTSCTYDGAGREASVTRANGQVVTFDSFDAMNRLLQSTAKQTPDPDAVTKYTYYPSGLLHTMQDPHLVAAGSGEVYNYQYDLMGRKTSLNYPRATPSATPTSESWHYDAAGRIDTFTNRNGNTQRAIYDNLNRANNIAWDDSGLTPVVTLFYDAASRLTTINNVNASISHVYFDDDLLSSETNTYADGLARTVSYTYDADANRASIQYPANAYSFTYDYTGRNQPSHLLNNNIPIVTEIYDLDGNLMSSARDNSTTSSFIYDELDRLKHISHALNGTTRTLDYAYDLVSNRKWQKRDGAKGDVFGYDLADQSTSILLDVLNPDTTAPGPQTITYDANGNRTTFSAYGPTDTYTTNNLNQYTQRDSSTARYDATGNMTTGFDGSLYTYDAQSRILTATTGGTTDTFTYDGLNRQVSRQTGTVQPIYNVYDGWNLICEYAPSATTPTVAYLGGLKNLTANRYYYHDASGSTSHLTDNSGNLLESYRYNLQGTPLFYDAGGNPISASHFSVRNLFTGQQWYSEIELYDLRNRFYSPDIGRFLQADPIGFSGDATNLYRYCGNNSLSGSDPTGLNIQLSVTPNFPYHAYWGVGTPGNMVYYDFGPRDDWDNGWQNVILVPGHWDRQDDISDENTVTVFNVPTTPDQDAAVRHQLDRRVGNHDFYNTQYANCYNLPAQLIAATLLVHSIAGSSGAYDNGERVVVWASEGGSWSAPGSIFSSPGYNTGGFSAGFYGQYPGLGGYFITSLDTAVALHGPGSLGSVLEALDNQGFMPIGGGGGPNGAMDFPTAVPEDERQPRYRPQFMTWWGSPMRYATAYRWVKNPWKSYGYSFSRARGTWVASAWSTDPSAYVAPPTTAPSGKPIIR